MSDASYGPCFGTSLSSPSHGVTECHVECLDFRQCMRVRERRAPGRPSVATHRGSATRREGPPTRMTSAPRAAKRLLQRLCSNRSTVHEIPSKEKLHMRYQVFYRQPALRRTLVAF